MTEPTEPHLDDALEALAMYAPDHPLIHQYNEYWKHQQILSMRCKVCKDKPRLPPFDHCGSYSCIPF